MDGRSRVTGTKGLTGRGRRKHKGELLGFRGATRWHTYPPFETRYSFCIGKKSHGKLEINTAVQTSHVFSCIVNSGVASDTHFVVTTLKPPPKTVVWWRFIMEARELLEQGWGTKRADLRFPSDNVRGYQNLALPTAAQRKTLTPLPRFSAISERRNPETEDNQPGPRS